MQTPHSGRVRHGSALIPPHGGYEHTKSFQLAQLIYDVTVRFCDLYVGTRSRTHDQMVQAARSGVQNIVEGSQASGTSKKMELKLTGVARASLEELQRAYGDFLRHRGLAEWPPDHPALRRFKARRCATMQELRSWVAEERRMARTNTDSHGHTPRDAPKSMWVRVGPCPSVCPMSSAHLVANAVLSLFNICCFLVDRQLASQAAAFEQEGGFTERLYRTRRNRREGHPGY
jgi:four helix bundle suffix protein